MKEGEEITDLDQSPDWVQCLGWHARLVPNNEGRRDRLHVQHPILLLLNLGAGEDDTLIFLESLFFQLDIVALAKQLGGVA